MKKSQIIIAAIAIVITFVIGYQVGNQVGGGRVNSLHKQYIESLDDLQAANSKLTKCEIIRDYYQNLYNLNKK